MRPTSTSASSPGWGSPAGTEGPLVGYIFEILSPTVGAKLWWANLQFIGIALLSVVWFEVVRRYTGHGQ